MVLHFKHQEPCHACTRYRKCNSRYRARAHEGYHEEGHEEYQRRSEIAAEGKAYDAQCRKHNKQNKVLRTEQSVKRGGADIDERNLYKFRGLDRQRSDEYPVLRTVRLLAYDQDRHKYEHRQYSKRQAHGLRPVKIAQPPAEDEKRNDTREDDNYLPEHLVRHGRGYDRKAYRRQKKCQRFDLKARAPYAAHGKIAEPLEQYKQHKAKQYARCILAFGRAQILKQEYSLKNCQEKQCHRRVDALPALRSACLDSVALLFAYIAKAHTVSGKVQNITVAHDSAHALHLFAVDPDSALGEDIEYAPNALRTADKNRVYTADRGVRQADIRRFRAADEVFPMVYERNAVILMDISPYLGL